MLTALSTLGYTPRIIQKAYNDPFQCFISVQSTQKSLILNFLVIPGRLIKVNQLIKSLQPSEGTRTDMW